VPAMDVRSRSSLPRVLVVAEAANPDWVSVPLEGWSLSHALRGIADVHLVTQVRNREAILKTGLVEGEDFTAIDSEAIARPMWRLASALRMGEGKGWTTTAAVSALAYPYFEHLVWRAFGPRIKAGEFDIVHRVTPLSPTVSSLIAPRCRRLGVPFIMGPLNGGVPWPAGFEAERLREREFLSYVRSIYKLLPGRARTLNAASAIIAGSRHTQNEVPKRYQSKTFYIPENGVDPERFDLEAPLTPPAGSGPALRACFIGRLVPYKGADMLLEAAAPLLRQGRMSLDVIGDGPMMPALREQARTLGISEPVLRFHGWQAHRDVQKLIARCNLFAFPSIREFGGAVVVEAMAMGLVPLIVDYAGPAEHVTPETGFTVPLGSRADIIDSFRAALGRLARTPDQLEPMRRLARERVRAHYTWDRKAEQVASVYNWILEGRSPQVAPVPALAITNALRRTS
jgi:glycosyltransferase involved in cell wall biosynthesis